MMPHGIIGLERVKVNKLAGHAACVEDLIGTGCDGVYWIHHLSSLKS
jgi:hypothetical protein